MPLFADDMILYINNPKAITQKLWDLICEFSRIAGYKVYIEVCWISSERENEEKIPFKMASKNNKMKTKLIKEMRKTPSTENYKTLIKKTEGDSMN